MAELTFNNLKVSYHGPSGEITLLDCTQFFSNKSRISMHRLTGQDHVTIPDVLLKLAERERNNNGEEFVFSTALITTLLTSRLIRSASPVKVLEYGCGEGHLSWYLAELLGTFHDESMLVCAYDTIEPQWMEQISTVEHLPKLSFLAGDFGHFPLRERFFDFVIINGLINFRDPAEVIKDSVQLAAPNGCIMCYVNASPLLESTFQLLFEDREEYEIAPGQKVLVAEATHCTWYRDASDKRQQILEELDRAEKLMASKDSDVSALSRMAHRLGNSAKTAGKLGDIGLKLRCVEQREKLFCQSVEKGDAE